MTPRSPKAMDQIEQYYEVLKLPVGASPAEVKQAYRNLAKTQHPDCFIDPHLKQQAEVAIKQLNEAYQFLKSHQLHASTSQSDRSSNSTSTHPSISTKPARAQEFYKAGAEHAERGDYEAALEQFTIAIRIDRQYREAFRARAAVLSQLGYENRALSDLRKLAELELAQSPVASRKATPSPDDRRASPSSPVSGRSSAGATEPVLHWRCVQTLIGHTDGISAVASYRQGKMMASGSRDTTLILWNLQTGKPFCTLNGHAAPIESIAISPDGQLLASGSQDHSIKIWHLQSGTLIRTLVGHESAVTSIALTPDKQMLISGGADHTVKLWDLKSGKPQQTVKANHAAPICAVAVSADGTALAVSSVDGSMTLWSFKSDGSLYPSTRYFPYFKAQVGLRTIALNARPYPLAAGSRQGAIELWDLGLGRLIRTFSENWAAVETISFRPDGQVLISAHEECLIYLWQVQTGKQLARLNGHQDAVTALGYGDSQTVVSGSLDKTIKLWRYEPG